MADGADAVVSYKQSLEKSHPIDVVILDLTIHGGMGGIEAAEKIRAIDPNAKLIVSSGRTEGDEMKNYQHYGFDGALDKTFDSGTLKDVLEEVLS